MSDDEPEDGDLVVLDEIPELSTEEGREAWAEILLQQDDETMEANGMEWAKTLGVMDDEGNMVIRFIYSDGREEVIDVEVRRKLAEVSLPEGERN